MKIMKRIVSGILTAVMVATSASFVSAAEVAFTDVSDHWAWTRGYIPYLVEKDVLNGYRQDDGTYMFKPEDKVTRAEFIKMLDETFGLTETANIRNKYKDVAESDWFYDYFAKAVEQGYIINYGNTASPNGELSREEAASLLVRYLDLPDDQKVSTSTFSDYTTISTAYRADVLKAAKAEIFNGYEENGKYTFRPKNTLTRAEALTILYRAAGAIFTDDADKAESKAFEKNAVIKNGNITLTGQTLEGRVIVSEGADTGVVALYRSKIKDTLYIRGGANVILDNTTAKNVVVDSEDIINLTVQAGSTIENLIINERTNVTLGSGTKVNVLTVNSGAQHTNISGTGTIKKAFINVSDVSAAMVPEEYEIAKGITATFASQSHTGESAAKGAFTSDPFMTLEGTYEYLNLTASATGKVYYYFTDSATCPTADAFDALYKKSIYKDNFDVKANVAASEKTFLSSNVKSYDYVVIQLQTTAKDYQPVIIKNETATGTGFSTAPYLKTASKIEFTTQAAGTVYWMYSDRADLTASEFLLAYADQSKGLKGEISTRTGSITVSDSYKALNRYVVLMYESQAGLYYTPVHVVLSDDGFLMDPTMTSDGTVAFVAESSGIVFYYFAESAALPTPDEYSAHWNSAVYSGYTIANAGVDSYFTVSGSHPAKYTHIIVCLRTGDNEYMNPVAIKVINERGFASAPQVTDEGKIELKSSVNGIIYYYYTKESKAPTASVFKTNYKAITTEGLSGTVEVKANTSKTFEFNSTTAITHRYMVIMLENEYGVAYTPTVVDLREAADTGFTKKPYLDGTSKIKFKTEENCYVWYYYTTTNTAVTADKFKAKWTETWHSYTMEATEKTLETIEFNTKFAQTYPYMVIATTKYQDGKAFTNPIVVQLTKTAGGTGSITTNEAGFKVTKVEADEITLTITESGELYYYQTSTYTMPSTQEEFDDAWWYANESGRETVTAGTVVKIPVTGSKRYMMIQMTTDRTGKKMVRVDISTGTNSGTGTEIGGSTTVTNEAGFKVAKVEKDAVTLTVYEGGELYYYQTSTYTMPSTQDDFDDAWFEAKWNDEGNRISVTEGMTVKVPVESTKRYMMLQLLVNGVEQKMVRVDLNTGTNSGTGTQTGGTSGSTITNSYGFDYIKNDTGKQEITILPYVTGELKVYFEAEDGGQISVNLPSMAVTKNETCVVEYPEMAAVIADYIILELTSGGVTYAPLKIELN